MPDLILSYDGIRPVFAAPPLRCGRDAMVIGASRIGADAVLGAASVIRSDGQPITIGDGFRIGARSTVHIATESLPTRVGDRVTVGRNAVVHACTVGSDVVIADDVVILDGAVVGDRILIEAGSIVFPRSELDSGCVYSGSPAKKQRSVDETELRARAADVQAAATASEDARRARRFGLEPDDSVFVASTARCEGAITMGSGTTILFSCDLIAEGGTLTLGAASNVQDNSVIRARAGNVVIGRETTIGHNVRIEDSRIGARSLIGIGCVLAPGTVVADDVLLAAGAFTDPGQLLESGKLWGGRPARILSDLDDAKRAMMRHVVEGYREHGRAYRRLQATMIDA